MRSGLRRSRMHEARRVGVTVPFFFAGADSKPYQSDGDGRLPLTSTISSPLRTACVVGMGNWFDHRRLLEPIGNIPPAEAEERYYAVLERPAMAA